MLTGADALELVLMDRERNFSSERGWEILGKLFPGGLMLRDFDDHRRHRRLMQHAFKPRPMADYTQRMNEGIDAALGNWPANRTMRFYDAIKELTLQMGAVVFMGEETADAAKLNRAFITELQASVAIMRTPFPGNAMWRGLRARQFLLAYLREQVPVRRRNGGGDLFSQLCEAKEDDGRYLTEQEIVDHLNFLLMAAHDTTTSALTTMMWALASFPRWQEAAREEVFSIDETWVPYERMSELPLTERVLKEALRLKPPVFALPRYALRPFRFAGYEIPGETKVTVSPTLVALDPEIWTEPSKFDPDRFSPERAEDQKHRFAWSPFGGGVHKCLGMHFAVMQVKAFCFQFLRRYRVALPAGYEVRWRDLPIPKPADRLPVVLERL